MPGAGDARGPMDVEPHVIVAGKARLSGMQTDADPNGRLLRPGVVSELTLCLDRGRDRPACSRKRHEEGVALCADLRSPARGDRLADDRAVLPEEQRPTVAEALGEVGRSLDVAEEERDGSRRKRWHR